MPTIERILAGKTAIVTGAGTGIGAAVAKAFAEQGAHIILVGRRRMPLNQIAQEIKDAAGMCDVVRADVSLPGDVRSLFKCAKRLGTGRIEIVVNNAGILGPRLPLVRYPIRAWEEVMRVNARGAFLVLQEALKSMQAGGSIINLSSSVGRRAHAEWGAYAASKFVVEALTQIAAEENQATGIRVNAINPGGTRTPMRAKAYPKENPKTLPTPESVIPLFLFLASDESKEINGQSLDAREFRWPK